MAEQTPNRERTLTEQLAAFTSSLRFEDLPGPVADRARLGILDTVGASLIGTTAVEGQRILAGIADFSAGDQATIWGTPVRATAPVAALVNGTTAHALELDDGCVWGHSGAVVVPAVLAVAEPLASSGRDVITATVIGYEIGVRIVESIGGYNAHNDGGWHSTGTIGSFAAAAAAAYLLKMDAEQTADALGIAGSFMGGTWAFLKDGAMTKRLHAGKAAENGVVAAYLARNGFTGPRYILEAEWGGFYSAYGSGVPRPEAAVEGFGTDWPILRGLFKKHASCGGIHGALDALLDLMQQHNLTTENVDHIDVIASHYSTRQLSKQDVRSFCDAQLSMPYTMAAALTSGGRSGADQYTEARLNDPEVRAWAQRITMHADDAIAPRDPHIVRVYLTDGSMVEGSVRYQKGLAENPLTREELVDKFRGMASAALPEEAVSRVGELILRLEEVDAITDLTGLLSTAESARPAAAVAAGGGE